MAVNSDAWNISVKEGLIIGFAILIVTIMLLIVSCSTIAYVRRQKAKRPANYVAPPVKTMPVWCFSFPSRWSRLRSRPAKQFTVSYRRADTIDPYDQVNIRPVAPPRPLNTLMPTQVDGYTLPHTPHPSHLIHPTSSLNRLRSEIENEVNPAIKYFTLSRETPNGQEEFPTAPRTPTSPASEEDEFYNTPMEHSKPTPGLND